MIFVVPLVTDKILFRLVGLHQNATCNKKGMKTKNNEYKKNYKMKSLLKKVNIAHKH